MKLKTGFMLRRVGGQYVVAALGEAGKTFSGIIRLNETGRLLWETLENDVGEAELAAALMREYDVDEAQAKRDVDEFLTEIRNAKLLK